jgi:hypothetical protein
MAGNQPHVRIVMTAMDAGAAHHITPVAALLAEQPDTSVSIYACHVAAEVFDRVGVSYTRFEAVPQNFRAPSAREIENLLAEARVIVAAERPNLVICGVNNTGNGPDEALCAAAREVGCETAILLDDRGPLFTLDGQPPRHLLATTKSIYDWACGVAAEQAVEAHLVGSLKHEKLSALPADEMRAEARRRMGAGDDEHLCVFIAQSDAMDGHNDNFALFATALHDLRDQLPNYKLIVRVHPGAPETGQWCFKYAQQLGLPVECDPGQSEILDLLAASDSLFSCISTSLIDYSWLSLNSQTLKVIPVYIMIGEGIKTWMTETLGGWMPELAEQGRALLIAERSELQEGVKQALNGHVMPANPDPNAIKDVASSSKSILCVLGRIADWPEN